MAKRTNGKRDSKRIAIAMQHPHDTDNPAIPAEPSECVGPDELDASGEFEIAGVVEPEPSPPPPDPNDAALRIGEKRSKLIGGTDQNPRIDSDNQRPEHQVLRLLAEDVERFIDDAMKREAVGVVLFADRVSALLDDLMDRADRVLLDRLDRHDEADALLGVLRPLRERILVLGQVARGWSGELGHPVHVPSKRPDDQNEDYKKARKRLTPKPDGSGRLVAPDPLGAQSMALQDDVWGVLDDLRAMADRMRVLAGELRPGASPPATSPAALTQTSALPGTSPAQLTRRLEAMRQQGKFADVTLSTTTLGRIRESAGVPARQRKGEGFSRAELQSMLDAARTSAPQSNAAEFLAFILAELGGDKSAGGHQEGHHIPSKPPHSPQRLAGA